MATVSPVMEILKGMGPAAIEGEIRGLSPDGGGTTEHLEWFLRFLLDQIKTGTNFELVEAYMGLFLKVSVMVVQVCDVIVSHPPSQLHLDTITSSAVFAPLVEQLLLYHKEAWNQLQMDMNRGACLLGYCRSATV